MHKNVSMFVFSALISTESCAPKFSTLQKLLYVQPFSQTVLGRGGWWWGWWEWWEHFDVLVPGLCS